MSRNEYVLLGKVTYGRRHISLLGLGTFTAHKSKLVKFN